MFRRSCRSIAAAIVGGLVAEDRVVVDLGRLGARLVRALNPDRRTVDPDVRLGVVQRRPAAPPQVGLVVLVDVPGDQRLGGLLVDVADPGAQDGGDLRRSRRLESVKKFVTDVPI